GVVAIDGRNWLIVEPDFWHDGGHIIADMFDFFSVPDDIADRSRIGVIGCRCCVHCSEQWWYNVARFEDGLFGWGNALLAAMGDYCRRADVGVGYRFDVASI